MTDRTDIIIVGGGVGGLSAAALAARTGASVTLLDGHPLGGRARTTDVGSFLMNQGAHAVYDAGEAARVYRSLGLDLGGALTGGAPLTEGAQVWIGGRAHPAPLGPLALLRTSATGFGARVALARLLGGIGRIDATTLGHVSLSEWLAARRAGPEVRALVEALVRTSTYCHAPDELSADAAVGQLQLALRGVTYLDGGWQTIVDGLAAAARTAGVSLVEHAAVSAVHRDGTDWVVEAPAAPGGAVVGRTVILAAGGPERSAALLGLDADELGWRDAAGPEVRAAALDLGIRGRVDPPLLISADEPRYLSSHAPPARLAPDGHGLVCLLRYLAPGEDLSADQARGELWAHAGRAGIHEADVVQQRYLHRMTVAHGMPQARLGGLAARPDGLVPGAPGVVVSGDWVGPTGMLADASVASAERAVAAVGAHLARVPA